MEVQHKRLLLVEDNPIHAKLMILQLAALSARPEVEWVKDGETALERLRSKPLPDLILLDLKLPGIDGHDVLKSIRADHRLKKIPVVMITTSARDEDISRAYELGVNAYLVKPLDISELRSMLSGVLEFWGTSDRMSPGRRYATATA